MAYGLKVWNELGELIIDSSKSMLMVHQINDISATLSGSPPQANKYVTISPALSTRPIIGACVTSGQRCAISAGVRYNSGVYDQYRLYITGASASSVTIRAWVLRLK